MSNTEKFNKLVTLIIDEYINNFRVHNVLLKGSYFPTLEMHSQDLFELSQELPMAVTLDDDYVATWDLRSHQLFIVRGDRSEYIKIPIKANDKRPRWLPILVR